MSCRCCSVVVRERLRTYKAVTCHSKEIINRFFIVNILKEEPAYFGHDVFFDLNFWQCPIHSNLFTPQLSPLRNQFASSFGSCTVVDILDESEATIPLLVRDRTATIEKMMKSSDILEQLSLKQIVIPVNDHFGNAFRQPFHLGLDFFLSFLFGNATDEEATVVERFQDADVVVGP